MHLCPNCKCICLNVKMHCCELQNVFVLGGGHLHLWSHKSGGGEAIQFQQGQIRELELVNKLLT